MRLPVSLLLTLLPAHLIAAPDSTPTPEQIIEQAMPSIVAIRADTPAGISSGTGFLVDPSGVVVTNLHVIEGATRAAIQLHSGEEYTQINVASYDEGRDLAILRFPGFELPTLSLSNSDDVRPGATVYAIGNPFGLEESVTKGIVSSVRVGDDGTKYIQTDSAVSSGNSGGPLINEKGEVVGVVTFKIRGGENINFAVPINYARALLGMESLMSLEQLARELGKEEVSLFSEEKPDGSLSGVWLSLTSNTRRTLRQDGNYLYGTWANEDNNGTYDLKKQEDGSYKGIYNANEEVWYNECGTCPKIDVTCIISDELILTVVAEDRIEGKLAYTPWPESGRARLKFAKTCGESEGKKNRKWSDFVWVRAD